MPAEGEEREPGDFIKGIGYSFENIKLKLFLNNLRKELEKVMKNNTLEQREVLKFKYGWNTTPMKLDDRSNIFGITINKVNNIEHMALRRLRNSSWAMNNIK